MDHDQRARTVAQVRAHLARRDEVESMIASGALDLPGVLQLSDADEVVAGTKLTKVMVALPGWGKVSSKRLLAELGIDGDRFVGQLNAVDREKLVAALS